MTENYQDADILSFSLVNGFNPKRTDSVDNSEYRYWHLALVELIKHGRWGAQAKMAKALGISQKHLSDIIVERPSGPHGRHKKASEHLQKNIASYLETSVADMVDYGKQLAGEQEEVFSGQSEIMCMPERAKRAYAISVAAARKYNLEGYLPADEDYPEFQSDPEHRNTFIESYLNHHISEIELYTNMDLLFATISIDIRRRLRMEKILPPA